MLRKRLQSDARRWGGRRGSAVAALAALVLLAPLACGDDDGPPTDPGGQGGAPTLTLSEAALSLAALGDSARLTATVRDADGAPVPDAAIEWSSTDTAVAKVNPDGWVLAVANGTAEVVASSEGAADTAAITVEQVAAAITVSPGTIMLAEGDTARLAAAVADSNGVAIEGAVVAWTSADEAAATVDGEGLVTAVRAGTETSVVATIGSAAGAAAVTVLDQLAFRSERDGSVQIYLMNADGSGPKRLTNFSSSVGLPQWSPDGDRIAFSAVPADNGEIFVMNADGSGVVNVTNHPANDGGPAWSPDGTKIVFASDRDGIGNYEIYVMNADGSGQMRLTDALGDDTDPVWSPDGSRIAFRSIRDGNEEIYVMAADGTGQTNVSQDSASDAGPVWSPDGTKIAFFSERDGNAQIWVMNADGSDPMKLTNDPAFDFDPAWRPRPRP
ncbi:MAG TPA: Ig-like domain-containing protein [Longimicrobiales bacterium]